MSKLLTRANGTTGTHEQKIEAVAPDGRSIENKIKPTVPSKTTESDPSARGPASSDGSVGSTGGKSSRKNGNGQQGATQPQHVLRSGSMSIAMP